MDAKNFINLTGNVPVLQAWHTDFHHYANTRLPILTEKKLNCEAHFGERLVGDFYEDVFGFLPVQQQLLPLLKHDMLLYGKLMFYQRGFIYTDLRLGAFVVPYSQLQLITVHFSETQDWIQFSMREGSDLLPAGLLCERNFYIHLPNAVCLDKFNAWSKLFRNQSDAPALEKRYDAAGRLTESFSFVNFMRNRLQYHAVHGSEYANFAHWQARDCAELMDFHVIQEFNLLKQKPFLPFAQFADTYRLVLNKPPTTALENTLQQMAAKLKRDTRTSVVLVSGIPGAGKGRFAASLAKLLMNEKLLCQHWKMPSVQASCRYSTPEFIKALLAEAQPNIDVLVAVLPSYHHLKKAIFELRKSEEFSEQFDIKFVVTKVNAKNFY